MNKSVARDWVGSALHIYRQAGVPELSRWFFIVAVGNSSAIGSVEVGVVHSDLSKICVRWTAKRVWKNEMQKYARGRHMSFSGTDRFRVAGRREDLCGESSEEREWIWPGSPDEWKGAFISKC